MSEQQHEIGEVDAVGTVHDVVVVGGGVIGLACARELAREGVADVVVLERRGAPGEGSTARANGGVRAQFTTRSNIEFSLHTIRELEALQRDTGGLPGFVQAGYLLLTGTERGAAALRGGYELQRSLGVEVEWLEPRDVLARAPFVRGDGLRAGTFCGRDGLIDPHGVVQALWQQVRATSVQVRLDTTLLAIVPPQGRGGSTAYTTGNAGSGASRASGADDGDGDGAFVLRTDRGTLAARWLVNAAGPDADDIAALCGVDLPCHAVRRNLACTDPMPGYPPVVPMCVDLDTGVLIRRESGGFLLAYSDPSDPPGKDTTLDPRFLEQLAERVGNRFPFLEDAGIPARNCWAGLYPETPDHHAIVGRTPGMPHFLQCVGFGGHGIMHSLAAGRAIAEIVARGRSETLDVHPLRFERFAEGELIVETAVL